MLCSKPKPHSLSLFSLSPKPSHPFSSHRQPTTPATHDQSRTTIPTAFKLGKSNDSPKLAEEIRFQVAAGDVIVAGTDGLFDNLHICMIVEIVRQGLEVGENPDQIAWTIAEFAHNASINKFALSPFALAAETAGYTHFGGKVDDITV